jgi:hypothetical protein
MRSLDRLRQVHGGQSAQTMNFPAASPHFLRYSCLGPRLLLEFRQMPTLLAKRCPACGLLHELYLPVGEVADKSKKFEFICPKNQAVVPVTKARGDVWKPVDIRPRDSVLVFEARGK